MAQASANIDPTICHADMSSSCNPCCSVVTPMHASALTGKAHTTRGASAWDAGYVTSAPSEMTAPMPIKLLFEILQPFRTAPWPMETLSPITVGGLNSLIPPTTALSWMFVLLPMVTGCLSPGQEEAPVSPSLCQFVKLPSHP